MPCVRNALTPSFIFFSFIVFILAHRKTSDETGTKKKKVAKKRCPCRYPLFPDLNSHTYSERTAPLYCFLLLLWKKGRYVFSMRTIFDHEGVKGVFFSFSGGRGGYLGINTYIRVQGIKRSPACLNQKRVLFVYSSREFVPLEG